MDAAKIRLSTEEEALIQRSDWILTKNDIIVKVKQLLESLQSRQSELLQPLFHRFPAIAGYHGKVSKGENYRGLPYLVLDHPRCFDKDGILAIRTMFWWGQFFSVTLHIDGLYKSQLAEKLVRSFKALQQAGFYTCIHAEPWQYHFERDNYHPLEEMNADEFSKQLSGHSFIKIAGKIPLTPWNEAGSRMIALFSELVNAMD